MNVPKMQTDDPPPEGTSPDHNPDGTMRHGIPNGLEHQDATGIPTSDRGRTETAPTKIENG